MLVLSHARRIRVYEYSAQVTLPLLGRCMAALTPARTETHCLFAVDHDVIKSSVTKQRAAGGGTAAARQPRD